ncbi:methyltransferase domain-containing protein [Vibrio bivalvicida]|uniref:SAM-dependent methyltransferase n=1 Tax=Vibrio bivalvicida TaxID=1276888 RepID=A0A177Y6F4_9VIBR|nr:class I SAM-dependent methyltransferase [Vibrio bivalvicida]OAJ96176.1 SAM-dependent methyltransferase [Vibrio bivalvicida]
MKNDNDIHEEISNYYSSKINIHGDTPQGVDWNGYESQFLRFEILSKIISMPNSRITVNDLGCGYGSYYEYLKRVYSDLDYQGIDLSKDMIDSALNRHNGNLGALFIVSDRPDRISDYSMASGIFNIKQDRNDEEWWDYLVNTLHMLDRFSSKGFSFNCLTSFSDVDKMKDYLYYADPMKVFEYCKNNFSKNVALLHDYDLYEFTILVRK